MLGLASCESIRREARAGPVRACGGACGGGGGEGERGEGGGTRGGKGVGGQRAGRGGAKKGGQLAKMSQWIPGKPDE